MVFVSKRYSMEKSTGTFFSLKAWTISITLNLNTHDGFCSYNGTRAYAQSKLANILHAKEIARQLKVRLIKKKLKSLLSHMWIYIIITLLQESGNKTFYACWSH